MANRKAPRWECDACGKVAGDDHYTDDEVCDGGDGPGFFLCTRRSCMARRDRPELEGVEERRAFYTARRTANYVRSAKRREPVAVFFTTDAI